METTDARGSTENGLTVWRRSYYRLRDLERQLVTAARLRDDPAEIERLHREIEALRPATTELFTAAQVESVSCHVRFFRPAISQDQAQQASSRSTRSVPRNLAPLSHAVRARRCRA